MTKQERDAWAVAYRVYDQFAPGLRQAAGLDDNDEMAGRLFSSALEALNPAYNATDAGGRLILLAVYGILENVFKTAKNGAESPQEAAQDVGWINAPPCAEGRQIA